MTHWLCQHRSKNSSMNLNVAKVEAKSHKAPITATIPGSSPSKFKQSSSRQFKSKPPQGAVIG